ncbi:MAG: DUF6789 family protein [Thermomicrobiales bacterium]
MLAPQSGLILAAVSWVRRYTATVGATSVCIAPATPGRQGEVMQTLMRGALAGLAATVPMTAVIAAGRAAGLMDTPPPVEITENVAEQIGENPDRQSPAFQAGWVAAHVGYGVACGALYAAMRPLLPRSDLAAGVLFGGAVWGISYISIMPALNLYPSAAADTKQRQAVMIAAHVVFGTALATIDTRLRSAPWSAA